VAIALQVTVARLLFESGIAALRVLAWQRSDRARWSRSRRGLFRESSSR
jgi:hypothetical protein